MRRFKLAIMAGMIAVVSVIGTAAPVSASEGPCDTDLERKVCAILASLVATCRPLPDCILK